MFLNSSYLRIRYSETDQMGYCYYGNYASFFEVGRVESLRQLGLPYQALEAEGVMLPVVEFAVNYLKPLMYDELIEIKTHLARPPAATIAFDYEIYNERNDLTTTASTKLAFISSESRRPVSAPEAMLQKLDALFKKGAADQS